MKEKPNNNTEKVNTGLTKFKQEFCEQAELLSKLGANQRILCQHFGVVENTLRHWISTHPSFAAAIQKGKADAFKFVSSKLMEAVQSKNIAAIIFAACNLFPDVFQNVQRTDIRKDVNIQVKLIDIDLSRFPKQAADVVISQSQDTKQLPDATTLDPLKSG